MPRVFAEVHDQLLTSYLLQTSEKTHDPHNNKIVFPADKSGYLVPCNVVVYILPTLKEGIRLAGFLRDLNDLRDDFNEEIITKKGVCYVIIDTDTQLIQGVSRSCWDEFGISCSFVEGNEGAEDVGVSDLFREFAGLDMVKLKSEEGIETRIDTSKLSQYHFIYEDSEEEEDKEESSSDNLARFREARVLLKMVLEADYFGNRVQVLKFTEILQEGQTQRVKSPKVLKRHGVSQHGDASPEGESSDDNDEKFDVEEGSVGTVNEELQTLKEIRTLFSNRESSRAMKVLMVTFGMCFLFLIGLGSLQLKMVNTQIDEFTDLLNYTMSAINRYRSVADVVGSVRQKQFLTWTGKTMSPASLSYATNLISARILTTSTLLSGFQFALINASLNLKETSFESTDTDKYTFELFVESGTIIQRKIYLDGYFQFMTAVDRVRNSTLASLVSPQSNVDPGMTSFNFAIRNGFGPLREGAEMMLDHLAAYHDERRYHYEKTFRTILIIYEILIAIVAMITIPFIFATLQTKEKIISLFGYIPVSQMESMVEKAEIYKEKYLQAFIDPAFIYEEEEGPSLRNKSEFEDPEMANIDEGLGSPTILGTQMPTIEYRQTTMDAAMSPRDAILSSARLLLTQNHEGNQRFNFEETPSTKMMKVHEEIPKKIRSEKRNRRLVVFGVSLGMLFWVVIFILSYVFFEKVFLRKTKQMYYHIMTNMGRTCYITYLNAFVAEEIATANATALWDYPGESKIVDQRLRYRNILYEATSHSMDPDILDLPSTFKEYLELYIYLDRQNVCVYYSTIASEQADCEQFANGLLTQGLRMIMLTDVLLSDSIVEDFRERLSQIDTSNSTQLNDTITNMILSSDYQKLSKVTKYLIPSLQAMRGLIVSSKDAFFLQSKKWGAMIFIGILILSLGMYAVLWYQSSRGLGNRIIKSKRMLSMIPLEFVMKNEIFKEQVLSKNIHQVLA